jgi:uncharacterized protein YcbX
VGVLESIWRYPIKGFTPERLASIILTAGGHVPFDRVYAVEDGPCGFDPTAPKHVSKQKFTVLAKIAAVARIRTAYDDATGQLRAEAPGPERFVGDLNDPDTAQDFANWLKAVLGDEAQGPLQVLKSPPAYRFMDHPQGYISIINLQSVKALEAKVGRPVDPLRMRSNLYVEGWPAWAEDAFVGETLQIGGARLKIVKTITRCVATHVDPTTGERDMDLARALYDVFGHTHCGLYAKVETGGVIAPGDAAGPTDPVP